MSAERWDRGMSRENYLLYLRGISITDYERLIQAFDNGILNVGAVSPEFVEREKKRLNAELQAVKNRLNTFSVN